MVGAIKSAARGSEVRLNIREGNARPRGKLRVRFGRDGGRQESGAVVRVAGILQFQKRIDQTFARGLITLGFPDGL